MYTGSVSGGLALPLLGVGEHRRPIWRPLADNLTHGSRTARHPRSGQGLFHHPSHGL